MKICIFSCSCWNRWVSCEFILRSGQWVEGGMKTIWRWSSGAPPPPVGRMWSWQGKKDVLKPPDLIICIVGNLGASVCGSIVSLVLLLSAAPWRTFLHTFLTWGDIEEAPTNCEIDAWGFAFIRATTLVGLGGLTICSTELWAGLCGGIPAGLRHLCLSSGGSRWIHQTCCHVSETGNRDTLIQDQQQHDWWI